MTYSEIIISVNLCMLTLNTIVCAVSMTCAIIALRHRRS